MNQNLTTKQRAFSLLCNLCNGKPTNERLLSECGLRAVKFGSEKIFLINGRLTSQTQLDEAAAKARENEAARRETLRRQVQQLADAFGFSEIELYGIRFSIEGGVAVDKGDVE